MAVGGKPGLAAARAAAMVKARGSRAHTVAPRPRPALR